MHALSQWVAEHYEEKGSVKWLAFFLESVTALTLFGLMVMTCADVMGRYFFDNALDGAVELTEIALAIIVFAEMPIITWRGGHVIVDILDPYINNRLIKILAMLSALIIAGSFYVLAMRMMYLAERSLRRQVVTEYLALPVGYIIQYIAIMSFVCAGMMMTYGIYRIVKNKTF
jgi:TRAP-type C4-dicarboxylate transport system permease small subunit